MEPLKIQVERRQDGKWSYLIANDIADFESIVSSKKEGDKYLLVSLIDEGIIDLLCSYTINDVFSYFKRLNFRVKASTWPGLNQISVRAILDFKMRTFVEIRLSPDFDLTGWKLPFSLKEYEQVVSSLFEKKKLSGVLYNPPQGMQRLSISFTGKVDRNQTLQDLIQEQVEVFCGVIEEAFNLISEKIEEGNLTTLFTFPEYYKTSAKQYLVYFGQFLEDLGVEATTSVKDDAEKTILKITPKNKDEALDKIREALDVYLNAPVTGEFRSATSESNSIAVLQWKANVSHLQGQLELASAMLQAKNATIEALQLSNFQLKQERIPTIELNKPVDKGDLIKGLVAVKKTEVKGVEINLPEILRRLKRHFK